MARAHWSSIRVSEDTKAELQVLREQWTEMVQLKFPLGCSETRSGQESKNDLIGFDQVIRKLILIVKSHRRRAKKSSARKRHSTLKE